MPRRVLMNKEQRDAFRTALQSLDVDSVEEIAGNLEDLEGILDDDEEIRFNDLPKELPAHIRRALVDASVQRNVLTKLIGCTLYDLCSDAGKVFQAKDIEAEAALPHCPTCSQKMPLRKRNVR